MAVKIVGGLCLCKRCKSERAPKDPLLFIPKPEHETLRQFEVRSFLNIMAFHGLLIVLGFFAFLVVWLTSL